MGRGRQKAKQTKVARELKYHTGNLDPAALQRELAGEPAVPPVVAEVEEEDDDLDGDYSSYSATDDDDGPYVPRRSARR